MADAPVGPTSYGDSPYQSFSAYAGNPYFVDLDMLCEEGLLKKDEVEKECEPDNTKVNYARIYEYRFDILEKATERGWKRDEADIAQFVETHQSWLPDYALFMALKRSFGMRPWTEWEDEDIRLHKENAVKKYREKLKKDIQLFVYIQYLFFKQWKALRVYAKDKGVGIIGDLPIYVAMDSADVWADPKSFQLDEKNMPLAVAGVPPDYFCEEGQLWGNPLYDWDAMKKDGYGWWIRRIAGASELYDVLRIDHFRGLESYWAIPYGAETAKEGRWIKGPGMDLVGVLIHWFPNIQFIAEDLGLLTPEVHQLLAESGLPGMKILEFAFDPKELSDYLPHKYERNCVCYAGTHDNAPIMEWKAEAAPKEVAFAQQYLGLNEKEGFHWGILRGGLSSTADVFIAQMQDYLGLGAESRMNTPSVLGGNWQWRLQKNQITDELTQKLSELAHIYGRDNGR